MDGPGCSDLHLSDAIHVFDLNHPWTSAIAMRVHWRNVGIQVKGFEFTVFLDYGTGTKRY